MLDWRSYTNYLHLFVDGSLEKSWMSKLLSYALAATIFVGFFSSFIQSLSSMRTSPQSCQHAVCDNDPVNCPGHKVCEPVTRPVFDRVDKACIYVFTFEYIIRLITCWAVSSRDLGIIPDSWSSTEADPVYSLVEHYARFVVNFKNLVDLATILPYYVGFLVKHGIHGMAFLRAFRLLKIFKLLKNLQTLQIIKDMIIVAIKRSTAASIVLISSIILGTIFFAIVIYDVEKGTFEATVEYPHGEYLRKTFKGTGLEISPFLSIPTSFYFVILSLTLTGDDFAPTSDAGRCLACLVMVFGMFGLTLYVGVLAVNFEDVFEQEKEHQWSRASLGLHIKDMDMDDYEYLFEVLDRNGSGSLDQQELADALAEIGVQVSVGWLTFMMQGEDANNDGVISMDEFVGICFRLQGRTVEYTAHQRMLKERFIKAQMMSVSEDVLVAEERHERLRRKSCNFLNSAKLWGAGSSISSMNEEEICILFDSADLDGSGNLCEDEVHSLLKTMGVSVLSKADLVAMISENDCDGDGVISREEFMGICYKIQGREADYQAQRRKLKMDHIASSLCLSSTVNETESIRPDRLSSSKSNVRDKEGRNSSRSFEALNGALSQDKNADEFSVMDQKAITTLFESADVDRSNCLEEEEVCELLYRTGVSISQEQLGDIVAAKGCNRDRISLREGVNAIRLQLQGHVEEYNFHERDMVTRSIRGIVTTGDILEAAAGAKSQPSTISKESLGISRLNAGKGKTKEAESVRNGTTDARGIVGEDEPFYDYNPFYEKGSMRLLSKSTTPIVVNIIGAQQSLFPRRTEDVEDCAQSCDDSELTAKALLGLPGWMGTTLPISLNENKNNNSGPDYRKGTVPVDVDVTAAGEDAADLTFATGDATVVVLSTGLEARADTDTEEGSIADDLSYVTANSHVSGPRGGLASNGDVVAPGCEGDPALLDLSRSLNLSFGGIVDVDDTGRDTPSDTDWNAIVLVDEDSSEPSDMSESSIQQKRTAGYSLASQDLEITPVPRDIHSEAFKEEDVESSEWFAESRARQDLAEGDDAQSRRDLTTLRDSVMRLLHHAEEILQVLQMTTDPV